MVLPTQSATVWIPRPTESTLSADTSNDFAFRGTRTLCQDVGLKPTENVELELPSIKTS